MRRTPPVLSTGFALLVCVAAVAVTSAQQPHAPLLQPFVIQYDATAKVNQLNGEFDKQRHVPTLSRTFTRYGLRGADLGYSFEHQGRAYFLFGDTVGVEGGALDSIATTDGGADATDPDRGVRLDFVSPRAGRYVTVQPPGIAMAAFDVPVSGISLNGTMYVVVKTNHPNDYTLLTKVAFPMTPAGFTPLGPPISRLPNGHFLKMSMHAQPGRIAGLPPGGPFVLIWGTGAYRASDAYLALRPVANFESGKGTLYFHGLDASGTSTWRSQESAAAPVVTDGTMGDISVTWCKDLGVWLMTYDSRLSGMKGVLFSYSSSPWGPWTPPQVIFNAVRDGAMGTFIHDPTAKPNDGLAGPVIGKKASRDPDAAAGGTYAPYVVERWTKLQGSSLYVYYVMSTWNPYVVELMKTRFKIVPRATMPPIHPRPGISYPV